MFAAQIAVGFVMFGLIGAELAIGHKLSAIAMTLALSLYIVAAVHGL